MKQADKMEAWPKKNTLICPSAYQSANAAGRNPSGPLMRAPTTKGMKV